MIKIIKGIYGYRNANGIIEPKDAKSAPFSLTEEQEERLVKNGVAEYVKAAPLQEPEDEPETDGESEDSLGDACENADPMEENQASGTVATSQQDDGGNEKTIDPLEGMSYSELQKLAGDMGLSKSGKMEDLGNRIRKALKEEAEDMPPVLSAAMPQ